MTSEYIKDYSYPTVDDPELLKKIYKKREFYIHKVDKRDVLKNYNDIKKYRDETCLITKEPKEHQNIIGNILTPHTPYNGLLLMYGVGTGKTMAAVQIGEQFKEQVKKYNTKIHVIVPGPNTKNNFINEILESTNNIYFRDRNLADNISDVDIENERKIATYNMLQYYKIMSYKSFYKKILGEKLLEKKVINNKIKTTYIKNTDGVIQREEIVNRIHNLSNTLLIVDEAHNLSKPTNEYGKALREIIKKSTNLKILLLTATPMINFADEIIELLNYLKPSNDQLQREKVFTIDKTFNMALKDNGLEYLQKHTKGYISFYRGSIPYSFADRNDIGDIPNGLLFTPLVRCYMSDFQYENYINISRDNIDSLDKMSISAANFIFPLFDDNKCIGIYNIDKIQELYKKINTNQNEFCNQINKYFFNNKIKDYTKIIYLSPKKTITGLIFKQEYIKDFSTKFYQLLINLDKIFYEKSTICFIYSNFVKGVGVELIAEVLLQNGYLEYKNNFNDYMFNNDTIHFKTKKPYSEYKINNNLKQFYPATFLIVTGDTPEDGDQDIRQRYIKDVFNNKNNIEGKYIKIIIGSRVMGEGITLKNCCSVHIMDAFYNIPKIEQVIGRAIRMCVHKDITNDTNRYPTVDIFKYVVSIDDRNPGKLSVDETLYKKAESKYIIIKKIERALKVVAIDCPLLLHMNMFPEEISKYDKCVEPSEENKKNKKLLCPALCDFQKCNYKCSETALNKSYWGENNKTYRLLKESEIDYNTFTKKLYRIDILKIKKYIIELYKLKVVYTYDEIFNLIKSLYKKEFINIAFNYLLDNSLDELLPVNINDFNNFNTVIYDKYNRHGYLIQRNNYYIFQPFDLSENVTMYYRKLYDVNIENNLYLDDYLNHEHIELIETKMEKKYDFEHKDLIRYYDNKDENSIVGIIDDNNDIHAYQGNELFKIRYTKNYNTNIKRGVGIQTFKGSVCTTAKSKSDLIKLIKKLRSAEVIVNKDIKQFSKEQLCNTLKNNLLQLEKYSIGSTKKTYMIIPYNHEKYQFPYNLEDRVQYIKDTIKHNSKNTNINIISEKNKYIIEVSNTPSILDFIKKYTYVETDKKYIITVE